MLPVNSFWIVKCAQTGIAVSLPVRCHFQSAGTTFHSIMHEWVAGDGFHPARNQQKQLADDARSIFAQRRGQRRLVALPFRW